MVSRHDGCPEFDIRVLDSVFAPIADAELERHLFRCQRCALARETYLETSDLLNTVFAEEPVPRVMRQRAHSRRRVVAVVAASLLLAVAAWLLGRNSVDLPTRGEIRAGVGTFVAERAMSVTTPLGRVEADRAVFRVAVEESVAVSVIVDEGEVLWFVRESEPPLRIVAGEQVRRTVTPPPIEETKGAQAPEPDLSPQRDRVVTEVRASSPGARVSLRGLVVERGSDVAVADLALDARLNPGAEPFASTRTDAAGRFVLDVELDRGEFVVTHTERTYGLTERFATPLELGRLDTRIADPSLTTKFEFPWSARLGGRIVDRAGNPIVTARVRAVFAGFLWLGLDPDSGAHPFEDDAQGSVVPADSAGRFEFRHLPDDRPLQFMVEASGYAMKLTPPRAPPFIDSTEELVIALEVEGRIEGILFDRLGNIVTGIAVVARSAESATWSPRAATTDDQGRFVLRDLPAASYTLFSFGGLNARAGPLRVEPGQTTHVELRPPIDEIAGYIVDEAGQRLAPKPDLPMTVFVRQLDALPNAVPEALRVGVLADGSFRFAPSLGVRYRLQVSTRTPGDPVARVEIDAPAKDVQLPFTELPLCTTEFEVVSKSTGTPIDSASLQLRWPGAGIVWGFESRTIRSELVRAAEYRATASARGFAPEQRIVTIREPGESVRFELQTGRVVTGVVLDASSRPIAGVTVAIEIAGDLMPHMNTAVATDADGRFTIDSAPIDGGDLVVMGPENAPLGRAAIGADYVEIKVK